MFFFVLIPPLRVGIPNPLLKILTEFAAFVCIPSFPNLCSSVWVPSFGAGILKKDFNADPCYHHYSRTNLLSQDFPFFLLCWIFWGDSWHPIMFPWHSHKYFSHQVSLQSPCCNSSLPGAASSFSLSCSFAGIGLNIPIFLQNTTQGTICAVLRAVPWICSRRKPLSFYSLWSEHQYSCLWQHFLIWFHGTELSAQRERG